MARDKKNRVNTSGGGNIPTDNPFAALDGLGLPAGTPASATPESAPKPALSGRKKTPKKRGRLDLRREKSGRGGKTVTVISGFTTINPQQRDDIAKRLKTACGCGGAIKNGTIELQGDKREEAAAFLEKEGFRPVMAGG